ncbi:DUF1697 domain-containing protein [Mycolicibacterium brumae]|uniref:DUF1697 domain-containing protein n=1 Tax=Mycolicibacterium brumae TaxID=85968 RepID=A0A2G5PF67_9MYCO|nr:DUF1697 domain-containing protein [Mycolicibacterium brumae]MCV7192047.1 DUF1697 domain-containing protein [Mycolicibacterium brumae]PIB76750.1 DUF1697 domain-containing protein [Mycolicibacterium brumae]UWW07812.1 DUF1697 domain-containing protein [Mycolicibacterium brumae]
MTRYAVLLRGVNVGGVNLKMAEVATVLTGVGFSGVKTVLATGNVLLDSDDDAATVRAGVEQALGRVFGYDAYALVYDLDTLADIDAGFPFTREVDDTHSYVTFVSDAEILDELAELTAGPQERIARGDGVLYWQTPRGATLASTIGKTMGKSRYKSCTTTRNLRTLVKMLSR